jgi:hypothetical protein
MKISHSSTLPFTRHYYKIGDGEQYSVVFWTRHSSKVAENVEVTTPLGAHVTDTKKLLDIKNFLTQSTEFCFPNNN